MPHIDLPSHRLHYRIDGHAGPWLVFCNSLGADLTMWDAQAAGLRDRFRILRYDRRGHGGSGAPAGPYAMDDLGSDVLALMDALEIDRAHFCGLSIGGLTGQWLALNAPERFDRVALCATAARIGSAESWRDRIEAVRVNGLASMTGATRERWFSPEFAARNPAAVDAILGRFAATDAEGYAGVFGVYPRRRVVKDLQIPPETENHDYFEFHQLPAPMQEKVMKRTAFGTHWGLLYFHGDDPHTMRDLLKSQEELDFYV